MLVDRDVADEEHFRRLDWLNGGNIYIILIETELESKVLPIIKSIFSSLEVYMPELKIIGGQYCFDLRVLLDCLVLFLQPLGHSCRHLSLCNIINYNN